MKTSLELLFHYRCNYCDSWWSVADLLPTHLTRIYCPHCGAVDGASEIDYQGVLNVNANQAANLAQLLENVAQDLRHLSLKAEEQGE